VKKVQDVTVTEDNVLVIFREGQTASAHPSCCTQGFSKAPLGRAKWRLKVGGS